MRNVAAKKRMLLLPSISQNLTTSERSYIRGKIEECCCKEADVAPTQHLTEPVQRGITLWVWLRNVAAKKRMLLPPSISQNPTTSERSYIRGRVVECCCKEADAVPHSASHRTSSDWFVVVVDWLMFAYTVLFSTLLSILTALACGSTSVTSFIARFVFWIPTKVVYLWR